MDIDYVEIHEYIYVKEYDAAMVVCILQHTKLIIIYD